MKFSFKVYLQMKHHKKNVNLSHITDRMKENMDLI